jgi:Zn-finger protein
MKVQAREEKENDKKKSQEDAKYYTATFDHQSVLTTPCPLVSEMYYPKYYTATFDHQAVLTTPSPLVSEMYYAKYYTAMFDHQAVLTTTCPVCHLWDEKQGKRGSCEIATC